jgi:hypothetical protein
MKICQGNVNLGKIGQKISAILHETPTYILLLLVT